MPSQPQWLRRLPEIIEHLRSLSIPSIDRATFQSIFQLRRRRAIELMHCLGSHRSGRGFILHRSDLLKRLESITATVEYRWQQEVRSPRSIVQMLVGIEPSVSRSPGDGVRPGTSRLVIEFSNPDELVGKLLELLRAVSHMRQKNIDGQAEAHSAHNAQYDCFERGMHLFQKQKFDEAKCFFQRACAGPDQKIRTSAEEHVRMCNRRFEPPTEPESLEECYVYGVALLNMRNLVASRRYLEAALRIDSRAEYVHYALAACLALSHDTKGTCSHLNRAIELEPRNRLLARHDSDFKGVMKDPLVRQLLYPKRYRT